MRFIRFAGVSVALLFFAGCASSLPPKSIGAKPQSITPAWSTPVDVVPLKIEDGLSQIHFVGQSLDIDLNEYSESLAALVRDSLEQSGVSSAGDGPTIAVQVIYIEFLFGGPCLFDYAVKLGDAPRFGQQSAGEKGGLKRACRAAMEAAVSQIVADQRTVQYLGGN
ncbi:MAG: hypothetical protein JRE81_16675 [Deltaproteobacteria bacterium]|jgi:hypothetical protein|nr:hypothetical protein [Deltaproteobacteria bacterium]